MIKFSGTVKKLTAKEISTKDGRSMIKNEIQIDDNGEVKTVLKFTKPQTTFAVATGTKVQITGLEQRDLYGNKEYKVDGKPESFILLDQNLRQGESKPQTTSGTKLPWNKSNTTQTGSGFNTFNGDGAKRGNALTNAVTMLLHNKKGNTVTSKDEETLLELSRMVFRVSTALEQPETQTKLEEKKTSEELDDESSPFD